MNLWCSRRLYASTTKCCHHRLFGHIISTIGEKKHLVRFDDGSEKECSSALLRVEKVHASLPPDVNLPMLAGNEHRVEVAEVEEEVADQEDEEPLAILLDEEEVEAALDDGECEGGNPQNATTEGGEPPNGMPGQLPTEKEQPSAKDYTAIKKQALEKIKSLVGGTVMMRTRNNGAMTWMVIASHDPPDVIPEKVHGIKYGMKSFLSSDYKKSEVFCLIFLKLLFKDWMEKVKKMNAVICSSSVKCRPFMEKEFLTGLGIMIGAA